MKFEGLLDEDWDGNKRRDGIDWSEMGQVNQSELTVDRTSYLCFREERSADALEFWEDGFLWKIPKNDKKGRFLEQSLRCGRL